MAKEGLTTRPWYRWSPRDFYADPAVAAMTRDERWHYRDALDFSWLSETPGRASEDQWRRFAGYSSGEWVAHRDAFAAAFESSGPEWVQKRMAAEFEHATETSRKRSIAGKRGQEALASGSRANAEQMPGGCRAVALERERKKGEEEEPERHNLSAPTGASVSLSQPDETAETSENRSGSMNGHRDGSNLTLTPPGPQANGRRSGAKAGEPPAKWKAGFEGEFWPAYLRHRSEGKAAALAVWMRIEPKTQATFDAIMDGLDAQSAKWRDDQTEPRFKPHARTWLFQRRWTDFEPVNGKERRL